MHERNIGPEKKSYNTKLTEWSLIFDTVLMNCLLGMYSNCWMMENALAVFKEISTLDSVSWNTMISDYANEEDNSIVVAFFSEILSTILRSNKVTFSVMFRLCGATEDVLLGLKLYSFACCLEFISNEFVGNSLINMLSRCGETEKTYLLFTSLTTRSIMMWNEMVSGYTLNDYDFEALLHFLRMIESGVKADEFAYSNILGACHGMQYQNIGEQIQASIIKTRFDSRCSISSSLINAYASFGLIGNSFKIFENTMELDLVCWGAMISVFTKQGFTSEALSLLNSLRERDEESDEFILSSVLSACANLVVLHQCKCVHSHIIRRGYKHYLSVGSVVINVYTKCGNISSAKQAFGGSVDCDAVLFNTLIIAYAHHGLITEAVEVFGNLKAANLCPTHATFVAVISACPHLRIVDQGVCFFDSIASIYRLCPSKGNFAFLVAKEMIDSMSYDPWPAIWRSLLNGCRIHGNIDIGHLSTCKFFRQSSRGCLLGCYLESVFLQKRSRAVWYWHLHRGWTLAGMMINCGQEMVKMQLQ